MVCEALMEAGEDLLAFPGGAHEAVDPAAAICELQKEHYGFGEPIDLSAHSGKVPGKSQRKQVHSAVAAQIEGPLGEILRLREQQRRDDGLLRRILTL
ncbi:MAG: hypothetical protein ACK5HY_11835 [Parahaliea sp.]